MSTLRDARTPRRPLSLLITAAVLASSTVGAAQAAPGPDDTTLPFSAIASTLGSVPDSPSGCYTNPGEPLAVEIPVSGITQDITDISVTMSLTQTWMGDMRVTLIAPDGTAATIFGSTGVGSDPGLSPACGDPTDLLGPYTFSDSAPGDWWATAKDTASDVPMPAGSYRASRLGDPGLPPEQTLITPAFADVADPNGTWVLRFVDAGAISLSDVTAASLSITVDTTAPTAAITSGPADGAGLKEAPVYAFSSEDPEATFQCRIDAGAFEACTSPHTVPSKSGKFVFGVRAVDPSGNASPAATRTYRLTTPPCSKATRQLKKAKKQFAKAKQALANAKSADKPKRVINTKTQQVKKAKKRFAKAKAAKRKKC